MKLTGKNKRTEETASYGVIGLGRFGSALALSLAEAGKEVIVVDSCESKVKELRQYTENAYVADELSMEVLEEIGIQNCDTVIVGIGEKIDTCILTTLHVVNLGVPRVIAKAISRDQGAVLEKIGAEVIYPERDMALRLAKRLLTGSILDNISLNNDVEIAEPVSYTHLDVYKRQITTNAVTNGVNAGLYYFQTELKGGSGNE